MLDEQVPFLAGGPLPADSQESFSAPETAGTGSLFEHCVCALDSSLAIGSHGLPLFGTGDWNDGMNRVGAGGRGESVWLGWFLHAALLRFAPIAERRGASDAAAAARWRKHAFALQQAIEREAWDGDWYRRGYFDDGTPLGSVASDECRIDSIAQSWAVISGAAQRERVGAGDVGGQLAAGQAAATAWCNCSPPPSTALRTTPAISRPIRQACAKMADSTPMPPCGRCWRSRS